MNEILAANEIEIVSKDGGGRRISIPWDTGRDGVFIPSGSVLHVGEAITFRRVDGNIDAWMEGTPTTVALPGDFVFKIKVTYYPGDPDAFVVAGDGGNFKRYSLGFPGRSEQRITLDRHGVIFFGSWCEYRIIVGESKSDWARRSTVGSSNAGPTTIEVRRNESDTRDIVEGFSKVRVNPSVDLPGSASPRPDSGPGDHKRIETTKERASKEPKFAVEIELRVGSSMKHGIGGPVFKKRILLPLDVVRDEGVSAALARIRRRLGEKWEAILEEANGFADRWGQIMSDPPPFDDQTARYA